MPLELRFARIYSIASFRITSTSWRPVLKVRGVSLRATGAVGMAISLLLVLLFDAYYITRVLETSF